MLHIRKSSGSNTGIKTDYQRWIFYGFFQALQNTETVPKNH